MYKTTVTVKDNMVYTFWTRKSQYEKDMERLSHMCHKHYLNRVKKG